MDKITMTETLLQAKNRKQITWTMLSEQIGKAPVWLASVCLGQNSAPRSIAQQLCSILEIDPEEPVIDALTRPSAKHWSWQIPQDPFIYRLYEAIAVYGESTRQVVEEQFGDGIMSAIDFSLHVDKVKGEKDEDRVQLVLNGKFLPYKAF